MMIGSPRLSAVKKVKEHLIKNIDRCYNDSSYYQTQNGIDLIAKAQDLLQQEIYHLWTDGRRILTYYTGNIEEDRDEVFTTIKKDSRNGDKRIFISYSGNIR
ncbi:hypothetical protein Gohar_023874, partial [Gossypium harknessii]|nr:hypothetical protein [Gossypium harknessii]